MTPSNTRENRRELATHIVGSWPIAKVRAYATGAITVIPSADVMRELVIELQVEAYRRDTHAYEKDWHRVKGDFAWSEDMLSVMKENCPNPDCYCGACEVRC
jgi:hypothetical protein